ncbi:MAG: homoserine kinase [Candidatus Limnocylindrales bacterium]
MRGAGGEGKRDGRRSSVRPRRDVPGWPKQLTVEAPASSANLGPGFDALALALDMWLRVTVTPLDAGAESLEVEGEGAEEIGMDAGNRFLIGLEHGLEEFGLDPPVMRIEMSNAIPLARGLGSSAAASVAGLRAAEALAGHELGEARLLELATAIEGHPDNASAAVLGGFVIASERPARFDPPMSLVAALFIPDVALRTARMRDLLPESVSHADAAHNVGRTAMVVAALTSGSRLDLLAAMSDDRLHEPYRVAHFPQLPELVRAARDAGALGAALSGAGSTVIALTDDETIAKRAADAMAGAAAGLDLVGRAMVVKPAVGGARLVESTAAGSTAAGSAR